MWFLMLSNKKVGFNFFSKLLYAQQSNLLYFSLELRLLSYVKLKPLIKILIQEGVLLHLEPTNLGQRIKVRFFLNLYKHKTIIRFFPLKQNPNSAVKRVQYSQLKTYNGLGNRATLVIQTSKGLKTHKNCLLSRLGGEVFGVII